MSAASFSERRVGARMLVARQLADGDELVVEAAGSPRRPSAAASAARTRPGPPARRPSARRRSRPSRPSTRAGTAPPARVREPPAERACRIWSGRRAGTLSGFASRAARGSSTRRRRRRRDRRHRPRSRDTPDDRREPEAQSRLTVTPATESGRPASRAAIRATLRLSSPAWFAQPNRRPRSPPDRTTRYARHDLADASPARSSGRDAGRATPPYRADRRANAPRG